MREPLRGRDERGPDVLGARVVLVDDRPPPLDHLALDRDGARRSGVHDDLETRHVVALALFLRELEHSDEHRRHELRVGDAVALDQLQALPRVEPLHDDDRRAEALHRHRVHEWRGMVEWCRRQEYGAGSGTVAPDPLRDLHRRRRRITERRAGQRLAHAFGAAGRAGRVEHLPALALVAPRLRRRLAEDVAVALEPGERARGGDAHRDAREVERCDDIGHRGGAHQRACPAVVEDVLHLRRTQVAVDRGVVELRALGRPRHLEEGAIVLHQHRDPVAGADPPRAQRPSEPRGAFFQLGVGRGLARRPHDDRGRVRRVSRMPARSHSQRVPVGHVPSFLRRAARIERCARAASLGAQALGMMCDRSSAPVIKPPASP